MRKVLRILSLLLGIACIATAGILFVDTQHEEQVAQTVSHDVVLAFGEQIKMGIPPESESDSEHGTLNIQPVEPDDNVEEEPIASAPQEMPAVVIDGEHYIALLSIPWLELELPIAQDCNDANLARTPCAYSGSIANRNIVIAGHNYKVHFGGIHRLELGASAILMDATGQVYEYTLVESEKVDGSDAVSIVSGDWDMALFTCVYGDNTQRDVLRFQLVE